MTGEGEHCAIGPRANGYGAGNGASHRDRINHDGSLGGIDDGADATLNYCTVFGGDNQVRDRQGTYGIDNICGSRPIVG